MRGGAQCSVLKLAVWVLGLAMEMKMKLEAEAEAWRLGGWQGWLESSDVANMHTWSAIHQGAAWATAVTSGCSLEATITAQYPTVAASLAGHLVTSAITSFGHQGHAAESPPSQCMAPSSSLNSSIRHSNHNHIFRFKIEKVFASLARPFSCYLYTSF